MGIQLKRSLSKDINPNHVLQQGQFGIEMPQTENTTDKPFVFKIGDGITPWGGLPYATVSPEAKIIENIPSFSGELVYTGSAQSPTWENFDSAGLAMSGTTSATDAGEYTASFRPNGGYTWSDGTTTPKSVTWTIAKAKLSIPTATNTTYNGSIQNVVLTGYDSAKMSLSGQSSATDAGTYETTVSLTNSNYQWSDGTEEPQSISWTIKRQIVNLPTQSGAITYNGIAQQPTWDNFNSSQLTISGTTAGTDAGEYTAKFTPTGNYMWEDNTTTAKNAVWRIKRAVVSLPSQSGSITYDGSQKSPSWNNYDSTKLTIGGQTSGTNAGTYSATFVPTSNYSWSDSTTFSRSVNWIISKAAPTLSLGSTISINMGTSTTATRTITYTGDGTLSATSNNSSVATASISGKQLTVTGVDGGSTSITVTASGGTNYLSKSASVSVSVTAPPPSFKDSTFADIQKIAKAGNGASYYSVGDVRPVVLTGMAGDYSTWRGESVDMIIIGINHNKSREGNGIHCMFGKGKNSHDEYVDVCVSAERWSTRTSNYNVNGWKECHARTDICDCNGSFSNPGTYSWIGILPTDLRSALKKFTKYCDCVGGGYGDNGLEALQELVTFPSEYEIFGSNESGASESGYCAQYDYFKAGNNPAAWPFEGWNSGVDDGTSQYWTRTPEKDTSYGVVIVQSTEYTHNTSDCTVSRNTRPIIVIG